ncbi:MAG: sigma-54-dependent Fis family transcriptional regulator, partial [Leptospira sp.]|nr:sigma-54-dependent Fis family transcriptional regulator [Leptospira sp.]
PAISDFLLKFNYPGDLEQLESLIQSLGITGKGTPIEFKNIPKTLFQDSIIHIDRVIPIVPGIPIADYEREIIRENLRINSGNREKTANILGISVRTLYRKLDEYDLKDYNFE